MMVKSKHASQDHLSKIFEKGYRVGSSRVCDAPKNVFDISIISGGGTIFAPLILYQ